VHSIVRQDGMTSVQLPEIFAPGDRPALRALVRDAIRHSAAADADTVVTFAVPGSDLDHELRRAGFLTGRGGWPLEVIRLDPTIPRAALRDAAGWWLAGGDFDVV